MSAATATDESTTGRELVMTRDFDAPRELVFKAFTDPKHLGKWWGPRGFSTTIHEMDARPGGMWRFMMHGPDGTDYPNRITYLEVVPPERLLYDHGTDDEPKQFRVTVTFVEQGGKTRLTMRSLFPSVEACERVKGFGAVELGQQTLEKLAEHLAKS